VSLVIADTSPLNYLIQCELVALLEGLFERVVIPPAVLDELRDPGAPVAVRHWALALPSWAEVRSPADDRPLDGLDLGESQAIALACELNADLLLIDERAARQAARDRGLRVVGSLGILQIAALRGLIDLAASMERLKSTNYRLTARLIEEALAAVVGRKERR